MKMQSWVGLGMLASVTFGGLGCSGSTTIGSDGMAGSGGTAGSGNDTAGTGGTDTAGTSGSDTAGTSPGAGASGGPPSALNLTPPADICPATCEDPAGTVLPEFDSIDQFYSNIVGRWRICSGVATFIGPEDKIGVEYEAPTLRATDYEGNLWRGNMYYLVEGPNGPERGKGFGYQLSYDVGPQDGPSPVQLNMHSNGTFIGFFKYSPCPREWLITGMVQPEGAILVPID